ncbi:hypothetical protein HHI36_019168 [Cryptolaemus montrouzieri]|uniref:Uncharacterized protein n=1 Tax=Cryptolaemus montrouzieri TaxID=559131 RepID=A0ABD2P2Y7_9CUCU
MKRWVKPNDSTPDEANEKPSTSNVKRRKFCNEYLAFGITSTNLNGKEIPHALNELNLGLQWRDNIFQVEDKIETILKKLDLWTNRTIKENYNHFPTLAAFLESSGEATLPTQVQD